MRVPYGGRQDEVAQQSQPPLSLNALLMAAALQKQAMERGQLAGLTQEDQPMLEDSVRTEKGLSVQAEKGSRERRLSRPPTRVDRPMVPGEDRVDPMLGVQSLRRVKGI